MQYLVTSHHCLDGTKDNHPIGLFENIEDAREFLSVQLPMTRRDTVQHVHCTSGEPGVEGFEETWNGYRIKGMIPITSFVASASVKKLHNDTQVFINNEVDTCRALQGLIK